MFQSLIHHVVSVSRAGPIRTSVAIRRMCLVVCFLAMNLGLAAAPAVAATDIDLTVAGAYAYVNGAFFLQFVPSGASGTGVFPGIYGLQATPRERGVNAPTVNGTLDTKSGYIELPASAVSTVLIGGIPFLEFGLDLNESSARIALNDVAIFATPSSGWTYDVNTVAGARRMVKAGQAPQSPVYELGDARLLLSDGFGAGSGKSDYILLVPASLFPAGSYIYIYSDLGAASGGDPYASESGFEEWGYGVAQSLIELDARIDVEKYVSVNNGVTWLDADAAPGPYASAGSAVRFRFVVTNPGDVTLTGVTLVDSDFTLAACTVPATMAPGATFTCEISGTAVANQHVNTATATGYFGGVAITDQDKAHYYGSAPAIEIDKKTNGGDGLYIPVGSPVSWTYAVTNVGNVAITGIGVTDDQGVMVTCPKTALSPGESMTCTAAGTAVAGQYSNVGTATGLAPTGQSVTDSDVSSYYGSAPALTLAKTASPSSYDAVGDVVSYDYLLTNSGNVTLSGPFTVDDDKVTVTCPATPASLAPAASTTCTASYTITQADLDAGSVTNTAQGHAFYGQTAVHSNEDSETVVAEQNALLSLVKTGTFDAGADGLAQPGELITYQFMVTNVGNVTLTGVTVTDPKVSPLSCPANTLAVGESMTCTGTYAVTQVDIDAGSVYNEATADSNESGPDTDDETVTLPQNAAISIDKTTNGGDGVYLLVGAPVTWTYLVSNTGNVTLMDVAVSDDQGVVVTCPKTVLAMGESMTCTGSGTAIAGSYENVGAVEGMSPSEGRVTDADSSSYYGSDAAISISKLTNGSDGPFIPVGDPVVWTYEVTNIGNVALTNVVVSDNQGVTVTCPRTELAVGESMVCTASGTAVAGEYQNVGTAVGAPPEGQSVMANDASSYFGAAPAISIVKAGPASPQEMGAVLAYEIAVTNSGNVELTNVVVTDAKLGIAQTFPTLGVGETVTVTGTYTVSEADVPADFTEEDTSFDIVNVATADADQTGPVSDTWTVAVNYEFYIPRLGLAIEKTGPASAEVGDTILYTIVVTNTGEADLANVTVTDAKLGLSETIPLLKAGESKTFTGSYGPVTEADLPGPIVNTATAAQAEVGQVQDTWTVPVGTNPGLAITKSGPASVQIGGTIQYTIVVMNTGDVTLANVRVVDTKLGLDVTIVSLAPGETKTFTPTYGPVTEADLPGPVHNTATASHPDTGTVQDIWDVTIVTGPALAIDKSGPTQAVEVGDTITYRIVVTNVGNVTLHNVVVTDARLGFSETIAALAPGESKTYLLPYVVGEADLTSELLIHNVATADSDETGPVSDDHSVPIKDFEQEIDPCVRSDVAVIIYGGWNGIPVRAWAAGAEQPMQHTAMNAFGEPQATWTFWPGEGQTFTVTVAPELPAGLDPARWSYKALSSATVSFGRCQARTIYFQLMDNGTPTSPTPVPTVPSLPQTGAAGEGRDGASAGLVGAGLAGLVLAGGWLLRRRLQITGSGL